MVENRVLFGAAVGMGVLESVMIFATEFWVPALVMAVIFGVCAWRLTRPGRRVTVLVVLTLAFLVELLPLAFYPRESVGDWVGQGLAGVLSLVGLIAAVRALTTSAGSSRRQDMSVA